MGKHVYLTLASVPPSLLRPHIQAQFPPLVPGDQNPRTEGLGLFSLGSIERLVWDPRAIIK